MPYRIASAASRFIALAAASLLLLVACAQSPSARAPAPASAPAASLYDRLGGRDAITVVVTDAIGNISSDTRINHRFGSADPAKLTKNLVDLVCVRAGGPCAYSGLDMSAAHEGMQIRDDEFDALIEDLEKSLTKFNVPAREKSEALAAMRQMRNAIVGH